MKNNILSKGAVWAIGVSGMAGAIYSGTLAYGKLTTGVCSFGSVCPYLLGFPVCVYGFFGFLTALTLLGFVVFSDEARAKKMANGLFWFSLGGSLFALYYLIQEIFFIPGIHRSLFNGGIGFPTCLAGFVLFGVIFLLVRHALRVRSEVNL